MKKLYYISWNGTCARFTRCFDSKTEKAKSEQQKAIADAVRQQGITVIDCIING